MHFFVIYSCGGVLLIVSDIWGGLYFIVSYSCCVCTLLLVTVGGVLFIFSDNCGVCCLLLVTVVGVCCSFNLS